MRPDFSRRSFLQLATAGIVGAAFSPALFAAEADTKRPLRKGIMLGTVGVKGSVAEKFAAIKQAGFDGVEPNSHMDQDEVMAAAGAAKLEIPSVCCGTHWAKPLSDPSPATRQQGLDGILQSLRDAKRYGAKSVLVVPAVVNKQVSYDDAYQRSQELLRQAVPLAAELRVKIAIENVWNQFLLSPLEAARYVDEFDSPWVGFHFDIGNIINYGWPEQWIRILNKRIVQLHIKEFSRKQRNDQGLNKGFSVEYLQGDNDWPMVMKSLRDIGYNGWGIAEPATGDINSPERLKTVATKLDEIFAM